MIKMIYNTWFYCKVEALKNNQWDYNTWLSKEKIPFHITSKDNYKVIRHSFWHYYRYGCLIYIINIAGISYYVLKVGNTSPPLQIRFERIPCIIIHIFNALNFLVDNDSILYCGKCYKPNELERGFKGESKC